MSIITLTTDFGTDDHYVAAMKGVILSINPQATIVDITHAIPPQDVRAGAFALMNAAPYFPPGTVHVAVVDPGVGSARRPIAVRTQPGFQGMPTMMGEQIFVGPDNGLFTLVLGGLTWQGGIQALLAESRLTKLTTAAIVQLTHKKYWRSGVSSTFHGRDIFAPVAAHLSNGVPLGDVGTPLDGPPIVLPLPMPVDKDHMLIGEIIHIDRFGNCITNILEWRVANMQPRIEIGEKQIEGIRKTYAEVERGELLALISSGGYLEIAVREGSAAEVLGAKVGDAVRVTNV